MTEELANIDLLKSGSDGPGSLAPRSRRLLAIVAFLAIAIVLLGAGYFWLRRGRSETASPAAAAPADAAVKVRQDPAELISLPPLDQTDPLVRQLVGALSSHPVVASWLTTDRLIVNFVVVTSKIADGQTPVAELKADWARSTVPDPNSARHPFHRSSQLPPLRSLRSGGLGAGCAR